jgi:hypothetical protein
METCLQQCTDEFKTKVIRVLPVPLSLLSGFHGGTFTGREGQDKATLSAVALRQRENVCVWCFLYNGTYGDHGGFVGVFWLAGAFLAEKVLFPVKLLALRVVMIFILCVSKMCTFYQANQLGLQRSTNSLQSLSSSYAEWAPIAYVNKGTHRRWHTSWSKRYPATGYPVYSLVACIDAVLRTL